MNCLYKTRMSLFNIDLFLVAAFDIAIFFLNIWIGVILFLFVVFTFVSILGMRIYLYEDKIVFKTGFIIKCSTKTVPLKAVTCVSCTTNLIGRIFHYGDIYLGAFNDKGSFILKNIKNAEMLCENVNELLYKEGEKR